MRLMKKKISIEFNLPTKKEFEEQVEDIVWELDVNHLDAVLIFCERKGIEPEETRKLMTPTLKDKLEVEGMKINLLPKRGVLPI